MGERQPQFAELEERSCTGEQSESFSQATQCDCKRRTDPPARNADRPVPAQSMILDSSPANTKHTNKSPDHLVGLLRCQELAYTPSFHVSTWPHEISVISVGADANPRAC